MVVTPVVALLTDTSLLQNLKCADGEVDRIFDHPLEAILEPALAAKEDLAPKGSEDWPYEEDFHVRREFLDVSALLLISRAIKCTSDIELPLFYGVEVGRDGLDELGRELHGG